jgi:hypothetical protein
LGYVKTLWSSKQQTWSVSGGDGAEDLSISHSADASGDRLAGDCSTGEGAQQEMAPGFSARAPRSPMTWSAKADNQFPNGVML